MKTIYYVGGSPCAGKSTVAARLAQRYGMHHFQVDRFLDAYLQAAAQQGCPSCRRVRSMCAEQIWMRPPSVQCAEELAIYEEIFPYVRAELQALDAPGGIIAEGAAFLPHLMQRSGVPHERYIAITPSKAFQVTHYRARAFVAQVLADCRDQAAAFRNWMDRDALFALAVQAQARAEQYAAILNDGGVDIDAMTEQVAAHFGLSLPEA